MDSGGMLPASYEHPDWDAAGKVHDWRNYISDEVRQMWESFTTEQKAAIARQADNLAGREEWD